MRKRIASIVLSVCLCFTLLPTAAFAEGTSDPATPTTTTNKTLMLGTSGISGYDSTSGYDYIYFGNWTAADEHTTTGPIKWRVLDDQTNTGETGLFLLSDALLGTGEYGGVYFQQSYHYDSDIYYKETPHSGAVHTDCVYANVYQGSDAQAWCKDFAGEAGAESDVTGAFTVNELGAILATTKSDEAFTSSTYTVSFAASGNILNGDKVFFLSAEEAENGKYGFTDDTARIAKYGDSAKGWWLRSSRASTSFHGGMVNLRGIVNWISFANNAQAAVRPAFNLNLNSVLFTSAAVGGKSGTDGELSAITDYDSSEWKLTLLDSSRNFAISNTTLNGGTISFSYSNARTGTNEYISVVVVDNDEITHYGRILQLDGTSGTASLSLPAGVTVSDTTKLYVFNEQCNGDKKTDYASDFRSVTLTVPDTTAPVLTDGTASRTSSTNATVTFNSSEAGTYYYAVVDGGATAPEQSAILAETSADCTKGTNTISLTTLTAGVKDIYIVTKDAAGNVSDPLTIAIPEFVPVYSISADTTTLDFGTAYTGYTAPAAQTVTIKNAGNVTLDLTQPTATNYEIGTLSKTSLAPNETATFTVQPKSGLSVGTYNETITVQGVNGGNSTNAVSITASFAVQSKPSGSGGGTYSVTAPKADNGTVKVSPRYAEQGDTVTVTVTPDEGYILDNLTVTDTNGNALELKDLGNGKYSFKMPKGKVTVEATFTEEAAPLPVFSDVPTDSYYYDAVLWAAKNGITGGNSATTFGPHDSCTRAQLVTFLWRAAGQPETKSESGMTDVATNSYYTDAVAWAFENGIVGGYGNGLFGSDDTITREQMAVILYRFAQHTGMDTTQSGMSVREYKDYESISDYAVTAIQWAVNAGVMQGYDGNLMPGQPCTRAQIVTMLYRLLGTN